MTNTPAAGSVEVADMQCQYNREVGQLLAYGFQGKFTALTRFTWGELAMFFGQLLEHLTEGHCTKRVVALQGGTVVGTLGLKWHNNSGSIPRGAAASAKRFLWKEINGLGTRKTLLLLTALSYLNHDPSPGECYIEDIAVHPEHQGQGVGKLLLRWAQQYMEDQPHLLYLSLHVSGHNSSAKRLYERLGFSTHTEAHSLFSKLLVGEEKWEYMKYKQSWRF